MITTNLKFYPNSDNTQVSKLKREILQRILKIEFSESCGSFKPNLNLNSYNFTCIYFKSQFQLTIIFTHVT